MPVTELDGHRIHVDGEFFLTDPTEWNEGLAAILASRIGSDLTPDHRTVLWFLREDHQTQGETATARRVQTVGGTPVKQQLALFPKKPAKKMAYIAGLPKPRGCFLHPEKTTMATTEPALVPSFDDDATSERTLAVVCSRATWTWPIPASSWPTPPWGKGWRR